MRVKFILPALTEARSTDFRALKYSLFPPLGLATLAGYLGDDDEAELRDEHVEDLSIMDRPDLVVLQVYITSAYRAYEIADAYRARGVFVAMGGIHPTAMPAEAALHADAVFIGPAEESWPRFLADFRENRAKGFYRSTARTLDAEPAPRRDLFRRNLYLAPDSLVVSRGCPHHCRFCYKDGFFEGGAAYYRRRVERALAEIDALPGRHVFFLDDHLFGDRPFALALFDGMRGMGKIFQAAGTVVSALDPVLMESAVQAGLSSLFIGFETLSGENLAAEGKRQNLGADYGQAVRRLHSLGVAVNGSFVFGLDGDGPEVFDRTADWASALGMETATFHLLTPYPGTALWRDMEAQGRIERRDYDLYDTRHSVFRHPRMNSAELEEGYRRAYRRFYSWRSIFRGAAAHESLPAAIRHLVYAGAWKKFEWLWALLVRLGVVGSLKPALEGLLSIGKMSGRKGVRKEFRENRREGRLLYKRL